MQVVETHDYRSGGLDGERGEVNSRHLLFQGIWHALHLLGASVLSSGWKLHGN